MPPASSDPRTPGGGKRPSRTTASCSRQSVRRKRSDRASKPVSMVEFLPWMLSAPSCRSPEQESVADFGIVQLSVLLGVGHQQFELDHLDQRPIAAANSALTNDAQRAFDAGCARTRQVERRIGVGRGIACQAAFNDHVRGSAPGEVRGKPPARRVPIRAWTVTRIPMSAESPPRRPLWA